MSEAEVSRPRPNYRRRRAIVGGGLAGAVFLAGAATGKIVDDKLEERSANSRQPVCAVEAQPGDTVSGIVATLAAAGDRGDDVKVLAFSDGHERRTLYAGDRGVPTLDAMQVGDSVQVSHVDPNVCAQVGGTVLRQQGGE